MGTPRRLILTILIAATAVAPACSSGQNASAGSTTLASSSTTAEPTGPTGAPTTRHDDNAPVLGYEVTGPSGTELSIKVTFDPGKDHLDPIDQVVSVTDFPVRLLFAPVVTGGVLEIKGTSGGPATITIIEGRYIKSGDPMGGVDVTTRHESATVTNGSSIELRFG